MRILTGVAAILLTTLIGCSEESSEQATPDTSEPKPQTVDFVLITEGNTSGVKADMTSIYLLDTDNSWQQFWQEHSALMQPDAPRPTIDFSNHMVIVIVDSDQPSGGYQLSIDQLQAVDTHLYVFATRKQPGAGCANIGMISQPFVMVEVPKSDLIPELRLSTETVPCQ